MAIHTHPSIPCPICGFGHKVKMFENFEEDWEEIDDGIKDLEEYTDKEKIEKFDQLYKFAKEKLDNFIETGREPDMFEDLGNAWEKIMMLLSKDKKVFWEYYNSLYSGEKIRFKK